MSRRIVTSLVFAALALPAAAHAGGPELSVVDVPVGGVRSPALAAPPRPFTMVALHWRGPGSVTFRTRSLGGRWSGWLGAAPEAEDAPDPGSPERTATRAWHVGNPYWTGAADRLETRTRGRVEQVRAYTIWSAADKRSARSLAVAAGPLLLDRLSWGANEKRKRPPAYAPNVRFAVIHHTAGSNAYTREQSAAIVRGIQLYHVAGNGWNDIGYNFLVDKYGQVFEGRAGGVDRPVVGAHAEGFNAGSIGVAVIGSYGATGISSAARAAIVKLLAWRLDVAHVDPLATLSWSSGGNGRFPKGVPVFLRTITGHRDTGFTDCPGNRLERALAGITTTVAQTGLPKIYEPRVAGKPGGPIRFTARLSRYGAWRLTITDATGAKVATSRGAGAAIDWTWDASTAPPGAYPWKLERAGALAASGTIGRKLVAPPVPPPPPTTSPPPPPPPPPPTVPLVAGFALSPTVLSPNGDGSNDTATVTYELATAAYVTAYVLDQTGTLVAQTLFSEQRQSARVQRFTWAPDPLPDGRYRFVVAARLESGEQSTVGQDAVVDRTLSLFGVTPIAISPNGDGVADAATLSFTLASPAHAAVSILGADGTVLASPFSGDVQAGTQQVVWDGSGVAGRLPDGTYAAQVTVTGAFGDVVQQLPVTVDTTAPVLTLVSGPELRLSVSEAATVTVLLDGQQSTIAAGPGEFQLPPTAPPTSFSAVATDAAGNVSGTIAWP